MIYVHPEQDEVTDLLTFNTAHKNFSLIVHIIQSHINVWRK